MSQLNDAGMQSNEPKENELIDYLKNDNRESSSFLEGGFSCLIVTARILGLPADYEQLVRAYPVFTKY